MTQKLGQFNHQFPPKKLFTNKSNVLETLSSELLPMAVLSEVQVEAVTLRWNAVSVLQQMWAGQIWRTTQWSILTGQQVISDIVSIHTDDAFLLCSFLSDQLKVFLKPICMPDLELMLKESLRHAYYVSLPCRFGCFGKLGACRVLKSGGSFLDSRFSMEFGVQKNIETLNCTIFNH